MESWLEVARIERSRGRIGEVLASAGNPDPDRFTGRRFTLLSPQGVAGEATVERAWLHDSRLVLKFLGVDSISAAEAWRGFRLVIPLADREQPAEGEFYLADLAGCIFHDLSTGRDIGPVTGWHETAGPVLLEVAPPAGGQLLIPFAASYEFRVDLAARRIEARLPEGLLDLDTP